MPRLSLRQRRARDVLKTFLDHHTTRIKKVLRWKTVGTLLRAGGLETGGGGFGAEALGVFLGPAMYGQRRELCSYLIKIMNYYLI
jgi:hypothetical protein